MNELLEERPARVVVDLDELRKLIDFDVIAMLYSMRGGETQGVDGPDMTISVDDEPTVVHIDQKRCDSYGVSMVTLETFGTGTYFVVETLTGGGINQSPDEHIHVRQAAFVRTTSPDDKDKLLITLGLAPSLAQFG
jgi:hypothetical protein